MRHEQSGERDITMNLWHRAVFGDHAKALDIDLQGRCSGCDQPLYVWEATRSNNYKATAWLQDTAVKLNVPGYLIWYEKADCPPCEKCGRPPAITYFDESQITAAEVWRVVPYVSRQYLGGLRQFQVHLEELRSAHQQLWHPGRTA